MTGREASGNTRRSAATLPVDWPLAFAWIRRGHATFRNPAMRPSHQLIPCSQPPSPTRPASTVASRAAFGGGFAGSLALLLITARLAAASAAESIDLEASASAVAALQAFLEVPPGERAAIHDEPFAAVPLSRDDAAAARALLIDDHAARIRDLAMPFTIKVFGAKPERGRSMVVSMHGGGGAPKTVNDSQWENQKRLYTLDEGVYVVPRAPTDSWNLWHQAHIDPLFDRLIENLIVFEEVDPDRVYLMGYSAGGDGVFQLAPRMADRFAAAAMMAGHPNETSPLGLRNLPFTIHMGGNDAAYNRNQLAAAWQETLADLQAEDPEGYPHLVTIHRDKGHWMDREDAAALPWMMQYRREPFPDRVVWKQDDVTHGRFYWLAVAMDQAKAGQLMRAEVKGQEIVVTAEALNQLTLRLSDSLLNLDEAIKVNVNGKVVFDGKVERSAGSLWGSLNERMDLSAASCATLKVEFSSIA